MDDAYSANDRSSPYFASMKRKRARSAAVRVSLVSEERPY